jgi:hypothetical protein
MEPSMTTYQYYAAGLEFTVQQDDRGAVALVAETARDPRPRGAWRGPEGLLKLDDMIETLTAVRAKMEGLGVRRPEPEAL